MERLYQPDFTSIFGREYANAFNYGQIDSLIWPIFSDVEASNSLKNLLNLKDPNGRPYFYQRKLSIDDELNELHCSGISNGITQAMALGRDYGIENQDVLSVLKRDSETFKGVLSFDLQNNPVELIQEYTERFPIVGIVLYPSFIGLDLTDKHNKNLNDLMNYCIESDLFIKIDIGNINLPDNNSSLTSYENIKTFVSRNPTIKIILSGLDISEEFGIYHQLLKLYKNLWIEIDPRMLGGMTPKRMYEKIFQLEGFIQNSWYRIIIGSASPTLEISQIMRGFIEATTELPFSQRSLLRIWSFRNLNRLNTSIFKSLGKVRFDPMKSLSIISKTETEDCLILNYKITLRSHSITQLLKISDLIEEIKNIAISESPTLKNGKFFLRSYHTTTTLIINEHEYGNFLDLHYGFAEISMKESSSFLHTVSAQENRADFNHYDHLIATKYGSRELSLPIINKKFEIGRRENFYLLVTFGPRKVNLFFEIKLYKK